MSVGKMLFLLRSLMKKCWIAHGRDLTSSEKYALVSVTGPYYVCFKENTKLLNVDCFSVYALMILVH